MTKPSVSVLMPVYNCEKYIAAAIESVLAQTFQDYELIVVDDGSTDGSGRIAASFPSVRCFTCEHRGISETRNYALSKASGEWIAFLDADDLWKPEKLEKQIRYLRDHPDCRILFCRYQNFTDLPDNQLTPGQKKLLDQRIDHYLTAACIHKSLFEQFGVFNPACAYAEDTEWTARLFMGGVDTGACLEDILYLRRIHSDNITLAHNEADNRMFYSSLADSIRSRMKRARAQQAKSGGKPET